MEPNLKFSDGEKVLCFHGPLLYEAKCIKSQVDEKNVKYFIHYSGWNKNWDEWVPESRVLKHNDANMQKQKELEAAHGKGGKKTKTVKGASKKDPTDRESSALPPQEKTSKQKGKDAAAATPPPSTESQAELQRKKRTPRAEQIVETEEENMQKMDIKIEIPDELKHWLVDDWDLINNLKQLYLLPALVNVETILAEYIENRTSVKEITTNEETALNEAVSGIREYFNVMLGKQLLYKFERHQYNEVMSENADSTPSQIYGAIHLLRLFAKIGGALAYSFLNKDCVDVLVAHLYDFMNYLSERTPLFSVGDYAPASPEYLKIAGCSSVL